MEPRYKKLSSQLGKKKTYGKAMETSVFQGAKDILKKKRKQK